MKFGLRTPSFKKRLAARTSWKRYVRHNLGFKAPRGWGWLTNPKRAAYNRVYNRTSISVDRLFKGSGRRRAPRHDGAALVLVALVIAVAALGAYLLIAGAIVFVGWLVHIAAKKPTIDSAPDNVIPPPPPDVEYQALVPVSGDIFASDDEARAAARNVFDAWLAVVPKAPRNGADLVRDVTLRTRLIGRLTTKIAGRRFVWRSKPAPGRHPTSTPPVDPSVLDPWNPPAGLTQGSRYFATCWSCDGVGRVPCIQCAGSGRVGCVACGGSGKYFGTTANGSQRLLNCKSCKGKGTSVCGRCVRGALDCGTCQKTKKLECWLEIEDSGREDVQVEPDGELTKAFPWGRDGVAARSEQIAIDARILDGIDKPGELTVDDLPASVPTDWKREHWLRIQPRIEASERAKQQSFRLLQVPSAEVIYSVLGHQQAVSFEGLRLLAPPPWADFLFARRAAILGRVKLALAALPIAALIIYAVRGTYFLQGRAGGLVAGIVLLVALFAACSYAVVWYATLGRRTALRAAYATVVPALATAALIVSAEPSIDRARSFVRAGNLEVAKQELEAIGPEDDASLVPLWADIRLREALSETSCEEVTKKAAQIPTTRPEYGRAVEYADQLAITAAQEAFASSDTARAQLRLQCASTQTREKSEAKSLMGEIALVESARCTASKDWKCALVHVDEARAYVAADQIDTARTNVMAAIRTEVDAQITSARAEKELTTRLGTETAALMLWTEFLAPPDGKRPPEITQLATAKARDDKALARQIDLEKKRAAAKEKKRIAAEELKRKRAEAAERRRDYQPLVCNDGSLSPSCVCGGSWRGCCSWHGGVSGCRGD